MFLLEIWGNIQRNYRVERTSVISPSFKLCMLIPATRREKDLELSTREIKRGDDLRGII